MIEATLEGLRAAKVLAIIRAKGDPQVAIQRGIELASMGCKAMEVTLDSSDWGAVVGGLRAALPADVLLGVGTVMDNTVDQIARAQELGATFALSPIDPVGFVDECHRRGVLAIPSGFTSNELWDLHRRGARWAPHGCSRRDARCARAPVCAPPPLPLPHLPTRPAPAPTRRARLLKLFHAGLCSPPILKSMLDVSPLGAALNILPSGGVSPANAAAWLDAGAACMGMGSNLVGKDVGTTLGTPEHEAAVAAWHAEGKEVARAFFGSMLGGEGGGGGDSK